MLLTLPYQNNNIIHVEQDTDSLKLKFNYILNLIQFAIKNNKSIYWDNAFNYYFFIV